MVKYVAKIAIFKLILKNYPPDLLIIVNNYFYQIILKNKCKFSIKHLTHMS